jgi:hypothetical protein
MATEQDAHCEGIPSQGCRRNTRGKGVSLIEILVGVAFFYCSFVMMFSVLPQAFRSLQQTKTYTMAAMIASEQLEQAASIYFEDISYDNPLLPSSSSPQTVIVPSIANGTPQENEYHYFFTINPVLTYDPGNPSTPAGDIYDVEVQVDWSERNISRSLTMRTYVPFIIRKERF